VKLDSGPLSLFTAKLRIALARLQLELEKALAGCEYSCDRFSVADRGSFSMLSLRPARASA
jgi:hypothetical protein